VRVRTVSIGACLNSDTRNNPIAVLPALGLERDAVSEYACRQTKTAMVSVLSIEASSSALRLAIAWRYHLPLSKARGIYGFDPSASSESQQLISPGFSTL